MPSQTTHEPPIPYDPDEADRRVLGMLYETGFMLETNIRALYGLGETSARTRIKHLLEAQLIERRRSGREDDAARSPFLYQITRRGYKHLPPIPGASFRHHKPLAARQLYPATIAHPLAVAELAVAVLRASGSLVSQDRLVDWWGEHRIQMRLPITAQHPRSESLLQPDGAIRVLSTGPSVYLERQQAPALSAWWVEVDRGTEDARKWSEKIERYARALRSRAWTQVLDKTPRPGLLVTVTAREDRDGDLLAVALWISHAAAAHGIPRDWPIWIAQHRAVVKDGGITTPVWRQIQIHAQTTTDNVVLGAAWSLAAIITPPQPYPMEIVLERHRQQAEQAEQERIKIRKQMEADAEKTRAEYQKYLADLSRRHKAQEEFEALLKADREAAERKRQQREYEAWLAHRNSFEGQLEALGEWWKYSSWHAHEESRKVVYRWLGILFGAALWLWLYFAANPTFATLADLHRHDYRELVDHVNDYILCPQFLMIIGTFVIITGTWRVRWEWRYEHGW